MMRSVCHSMLRSTWSAMSSWCSHSAGRSSSANCASSSGSTLPTGHSQSAGRRPASRSPRSASSASSRGAVRPRLLMRPPSHSPRGNSSSAASGASSASGSKGRAVLPIARGSVDHDGFGCDAVSTSSRGSAAKPSRAALARACSATMLARVPARCAAARCANLGCDPQVARHFVGQFAGQPVERSEVIDQFVDCRLHLRHARGDVGGAVAAVRRKGDRRGAAEAPLASFTCWSSASTPCSS